MNHENSVRPVHPFRSAAIHILGLGESAFQFEKEINEQTARLRKSGWRLVLWEPFSSDEWRQIRKRVKQAILADDASVFPGDLWRAFRNRARLSRRPDLGDFGVLVGSAAESRVPGSDALSADIQQSVDFAVGRALDEKVPRLRALKDYDHCVLMLTKGHPLVNAHNVAQALACRSADANSLARVYLVTPQSVDLLGGRDSTQVH
jgi:hypothetical protein